MYTSDLECVIQSSNLTRSTISSVTFNFLGICPQKIPSIKNEITIIKGVEMESVKPVNEAPLRKARLLGIVYLVFAIVLPFIILLIPESELPVSTGPIEVFSWLMILLMPIEILLIYVSYRFFRKRSELGNIMGPAALMYVLSLAPSIYAFIIGFIGSALRLIAIPMGLTVSLVGFWLIWMFLSNLWENIQVSENR
ncbi:MAG: hypothetical protein ThorAB25_22050 [Candidatus Thorarchaeota archaeon AB_25]|nr:MAG: hypothetical protein ThorAB25_22050 [Candidatus Thorarchaeota archaeon AB_25]